MIVQVLKDGHLFALVGGVLGVDALVLLIWGLIDSPHISTVLLPGYVSTLTLGTLRCCDVKSTSFGVDLTSEQCRVYYFLANLRFYVMQF